MSNYIPQVITCKGTSSQLLLPLVVCTKCLELTSLVSCNAAAVLWKAGEAVKVEEIKVDPPKTGEVRIKMLFASVCHTDILYRDGFDQVRGPLFNTLKFR